MSMIAKETTGVSIEKLENGVYTAVSSMIIDLGKQTSEKFGKTQRKFMMIWNIVGEEVEINGKKLPRTMSKEYGYSLGEKSNLRRDLQAWRGQPFTSEELQGFNLLKILNKPCQLQIIKEEKNGNTYNNISSIMALPKGMTIELLEETSHFDIEDVETWKNWGKIPSWIQDKIKKADNYEESGLDKFVTEYEETMKEQEGKQEENQEYSVEDDRITFLIGGSLCGKK